MSDIDDDAGKRIPGSTSKHYWDSVYSPVAKKATPDFDIDDAIASINLLSAVPSDYSQDYGVMYRVGFERAKKKAIAILENMR